MARDAQRAESPASSAGGNKGDGGSGKDKKAKSRRPANTAFRQQRLKAWQPILTPKTVLPLFFIVGIIFAPLGGLMLYASAKVQELVIDYSQCTNAAGDGGAPFTKNINQTNNLGDIPADKYSLNFGSSAPSGQNPQWVQWTQTVSYYAGRPVTDQSQLPANAKPHDIQDSPMCSLFFEIPQDMGPSSSPVLLYYRLTNFYQNHRRYVKSFNSDQLAGSAQDAAAVAGSSCDPLTVNNTDDIKHAIPYYPCGIVANSQFNDTFSSPLALNAKGSNVPVPYNMTSKGIAWKSDAKLYAPNPYHDKSTIAVPPYWSARWGPDNYTEENPPPPLDTYEEFQVWMRTAGLPTFSKLALRNDNETMTAGRYRLDIVMNFPVLKYGGTKSIVISTSTVIGGKNPFLGVAFVVVAGLCVLLGLIFTAAQLVKPRKLGDHTHLTWNNEQPSTATTTGAQRPGATDP